MTRGEGGFRGKGVVDACLCVCALSPFSLETLLTDFPYPNLATSLGTTLFFGLPFSLPTWKLLTV